MRQATKSPYDPGPGISIASLAYEYPPAWQVPVHAHGSDQLIYATAGVMEIAAAQSLWLTPPQFAVWIPANVNHSIRMPGAVSMRTLYLRPGLARGKQCAVLHVTPLLRELIVEAVRIGNLKARNKSHAALRDVIVAQIGCASPIPTMLAMPSDTRARAIADAVIANPKTTLLVSCQKAGVSMRTLQRIFRREVGTDFETWRRQVRMMKAVELLTQGTTIKQISHTVGYRQASTFVAAFRRVFGMPPKSWIAAVRQGI
jgi:AraC-like DNA-binding protein